MYNSQTTIEQKKELEDRITVFMEELKELERKHRFSINHHGDHISFLEDTKGDNFRRYDTVARIFGDGYWEPYE